LDALLSLDALLADDGALTAGALLGPDVLPA
jgi:hypothetical protein